MKKLLIPLLLFAFLMSVVPALAVPLGDLHALARYFPETTPVFVSLRTDDGYVETLDGLLARIGAVVPPEAMPPMTLAQGLDEAVSQIKANGSFQGDVRPWLGDTASFGLLSFEASMDRDRSNDNDNPFLITLALKDRALATTFITDALENQNSDFTRTEGADYTVVTMNEIGTSPNLRGRTAFILRDDALLLTNDISKLPEGGVPGAALSDNPEFNETLEILPEDSYNISLFIDLPTIFDSAVATDPDAAEMMGMFGTLFNVIGPQAWGLTILDGVSATADIVQRLGDMSQLEAMGFPMQSMRPVNPNFAAHIPTNIPLSIQAADLKNSIEGAIASLERTAEMLEEADQGDMSSQEISEGVAQFEQAFKAITGLDFRDEFISWMSGDYALFLGLNPGLDTSSMQGVMSTFPVDFGLIIEATEPTAAQNTLEGITRGLNQSLAMMGLTGNDDNPNQPKIEISSETIGTDSVTVLTISSRDLPWPVEILMGADDQVFALGTRNAVTFALNPDGGLPANSEYQRAQTYMLNNPTGVAWLGTAGLLPLADLVGAMNGSTSDDELEQVRSLLGLFSSGTMTSRVDENGNQISRAVLTFAP